MDAPTQQPSGSDHMVVAADLPDLSPRQAFDYFITPELLARWWPPEADVDARSGGEYVLRWPKMGWALSGRYTAFEPGERLAFTWQWAHRPELPARTVDVRFAPSATGCRVAITHGTYGDSPVEQADRQSHIDGWLHFLGQLRAVTQPVDS
ncbi:SRPBCC domain-containing protein [Promineifilum sp.]|uniref:SRPBCC family protein n=1 Tax=Promineifilum sp. TaxID=2664178 RepID=UPI0035AF15F7